MFGQRPPAVAHGIAYESPDAIGHDEEAGDIEGMGTVAMPKGKDKRFICAVSSLSRPFCFQFIAKHAYSTVHILRVYCEVHEPCVVCPHSTECVCRTVCSGRQEPNCP